MTSNLQRTRENLHNTLSDESKPWTQYLNVLETITGINRSVIFVGSVSLLGWWLLFGISEEFMSNLIGIVYPVFRSICAIEAPAKGNDIIKWLMYWIVFGLFCFIEFIVEIFITTIPFYALFKCSFLIWLMAPVEINGAFLIYNHLIKRLIESEHERE